MDLSKYTEETYLRIVTFKTAFYSFYLPVVCGLLVGGINTEAAFATAQDVCIQMGQYFQVGTRALSGSVDPLHITWTLVVVLSFCPSSLCRLLRPQVRAVC